MPESTICGICREARCNFKTECGHEFHENCLNKWLKQKTSCPYCSQQVLPVKFAKNLQKKLKSGEINDFEATMMRGILKMIHEKDFKFTEIYPAALIEKIFSLGFEVEGEGPDKLFLNACALERFDILEVLKKSGYRMRLGYGDQFGYDPLSTAIQNHNLKLFTWLMDFLEEYGAFAEVGSFVYTISCTYEDKTMAKRLFLNGNVISDGERNRLPQSLCAQSNDVKFLTFLLDNGADSDLSDLMDNYPLHEACECKNIEIVKLYIKAKADLNVQNSMKETPLMLSIGFSADQEIAKLLIKTGADLNLKNYQGNTALHLAVSRSEPVSENLSKKLIVYGAKIDAVNANKETPLHLAVKAGNFHVVELLLMCGANVDLRDSSGKTSWQLAEASKHQGIIGLFKYYNFN